MSDNKPSNFELFNDDWERVMTPPNLTTEHQRSEYLLQTPTSDVDKSKDESSPSTTMNMEQKPEEPITIEQSESNDVLDIFKQMQISETTPKIPVIDLYSCMPMPTAPIRGDMANMMSQTRKIFDIYQPFLNSLYANIEEFGYCLSYQMCTELANYFEKVQERMGIWSDVLQQMASTETFGSAIFNFIGLAPSSNSDYQQQIADVLHEITQIFNNFIRSDLSATVHQKCQHAKGLRGLAVPFVGRGGMDLATALASSSQQKKSQYVFFHNAALPPGPNTNECFELFNQLISKGERCIYVDTSLANIPSIIPVGDRIAKFFITSLVNTDYLQEAARKIYTCIVRMEGAISSDKSAKVNDTPKHEQFELEIPCPKAAKYGGQCSNDECRWECDDCGKLVVIRKPGEGDTRVEHLHCACGQVPLTGAEFRCKDADVHGYEEFVGFPSAELADQLRYYGEKNLLILGETGVGKSTWINAFANFITFSTLEEAIQSEKPLCLIPTSFPRFDKKDLTERTITIGPQDSNESSKTGQSQTKMPKAHVFELKTGRMRMVDTPGMADTAGLKQDQQNFKQTLRYISTLKELNGIAILIDANLSRLTPAFKYCIGQLLTQLHKDAAKNIVFVFTKCGQRRDPGTALSSLRTYLDEVKRNTSVEVKTGPDQVYIMENDAFKFIHEVNQGVEYSNADYEHMEFSWSLSKSESTRLLQNILNLKPHKPMDTFSLNQARSYILALALPLAKISQAIQTDITVLTEKRDWLQTLDANELDLETAKNAMKITQSYYEIEHLNYPRTVCNSAQHTEVVVDDRGQQKILYKTICHSQCGLNDVPPDTSHCNQLRGCWAMNGDNCHQCGCHYTEHMHIRYLQHLRTKLVDDDQQIAGVMTQLDKTHDKKAAVEDMIILLEKRVDDQHAEQAIISKCSAKLSMFLKRHAIMTYNDAIEEYVQMSIDEEKRIAAVSGDNRKVEGLEDCLKAYREEKLIINAAMNSKEQPENDEFDVQAIYGELINLQINGQNIKQMFDAEFDSQKKIYDFAERSYPRQNGGKASMNNNRSRQSSSQRGSQQQAQNYSNHGQHQNGKSMGFSSSYSNTYMQNRPSNATSSGQFSNSFYGNNFGTANNSQQLQKQERKFGETSASGQLSYADAATKAQNPKDKPSSSTSSKSKKKGWLNTWW